MLRPPTASELFAWSVMSKNFHPTQQPDRTTGQLGFRDYRRTPSESTGPRTQPNQQPRAARDERPEASSVPPDASTDLLTPINIDPARASASAMPTPTSDELVPVGGTQSQPGARSVAIREREVAPEDPTEDFGEVLQRSKKA